MTRESWHERLEAYLDGELDPLERTRFEAETEADAEFVAELAQRRRLRDAARRALGGDLGGELPADLASLAAAHGRHVGRSRTNQNQRRAWVAVALAATLTLAILAPSLLRNLDGAVGPRSPITRAGQVVAVRFGEEAGRAVTLEAGCYDLETGDCR